MKTIRLWGDEYYICDGPGCQREVPAGSTDHIALDFCSEKCSNTYYRHGKARR